jgi:hypothetical protein
MIADATAAASSTTAATTPSPSSSGEVGLFICARGDLVQECDGV